MVNKKFVILIILGAVLFTVLSTAFIVRETEQVLILRFGEAKRVITEPGLNFKVPIADTAVFFDKRVLDYDAPKQEIPTSDQKQLLVDAFARYKIVDPLLFYQTVRNERGIQERFSSMINTALRDVLGRVSLAYVLTPERAKLMEDFTDKVSSSAKGFGIDVIDVRIKRIDLPNANSQAIYRRMSTQREQEAKLIRAEGSKESRRIKADGDKLTRILLSEANKTAEILRGDGDGQSQKVYNAAYSKNVKFFDFWRSMQAMAKGLGSSSTTYVGAADGDFFRFFK